MAEPLRTYQPIWKKLKSQPGVPVALQVHQPRLAARIRKGVIMEKYRDVGFKVINELEVCTLKIQYDPKKHQLTFTLMPKYGLVAVES
jgi:hypothetical protein